MKLEVLPGNYSVARLGPLEQIPEWFQHEGFSNVTRTKDELSLVCLESIIPHDVSKETGWRIIKIQGPLDFGQTGVLSSILAPLAKAKISIFSVSTFDTDYILVKDQLLESAKDVLIQDGHSFI